MSPLAKEAIDARLCGIWGRPYLDLSPLLDTSCFAELDDEIVGALPHVETSYTGGSLKWMGVTAPWVDTDPYVDYMRVIEDFSRDEFVRFVSFGPEPERFDFDRHTDYRFGDETDNPLTRQQMLYL